MNNINKLNKTFIQNQTLTHGEMNSVTGKIDEVINKLGEVITYINTLSNVGGGGSGTDSIDEQTIKSWIAEAIAGLKDLVDAADQDLEDRITALQEAGEGPSESLTEEEWVRIFKKSFNITDPDAQTSQQIMNAIMQRMEVIGEDGKPTWDVTALQQIQSDLNTVKTQVASISVLSDKISLIVKERNGEDVVDRAAIVAAINNGQSTVGIEATNIILDGNTTLTQAIANKIDVDDLNATKAEIKSAIVGDIEAGSVTITGDLHYNRIIGNTTQVNTNTQLDNNAYFVQVTNNNYDNYITVTLPSDPVMGQTVFIGGTPYYNLTANKQIHVYYREVVAEENYKQYLRSGVVNAGESQSAFDAGWQGYVEFIYTGQYWQQLIHNISIA